jgi:putative transposase
VRATVYNWRAHYCGMEVSQLRRLKELEAENARLKRMYADLSLDQLYAESGEIVSHRPKLRLS